MKEKSKKNQKETNNKSLKNDKLVSKNKNLDISVYELHHDKLRWTCPETIFNFKTTEELEPLETIVGQSRAIEAIRLGAGLNSKGYNIFVSGLSGTGRLSTVKKILDEIKPQTDATFDYCYVNNFSNPDYPRLIKLKAGQGKEFSFKIEEAINILRIKLPKLFEEESFQESRKKIYDEYQKKEKQIIQEFDRKIEPFGFVRGQLENEQGILQPEVFPVIDKKAVNIENLNELVSNGVITKDKANELRELYSQFHEEVLELFLKDWKIIQDFKRELNNIDKNAVSNVLLSFFDEIKKQFQNEKINLYADECYNYILNNISVFVPAFNQYNQKSEEDNEQNKEDFYSVFRVNVVLDNSDTTSAPIIIETTPSYTNLFGTIDRTFDSRGYWITDFTKIKAGSILRADQGFLIVNALDLFEEPGVWTALKRVLLYNKLEIQPFEAAVQLAQFHLKPEAIDVNVKVVIIGGQTLYRMLYHYEKGFKKIFKINAQFDYEIERSDEMLMNYAAFISKICRSENLDHCTPDGVAAIAEWAVEHAGSQNKITLKFSDVADILREAAFYDKGSERRYINREDVEKAIECRRHRNNLMDEKLSEIIIDGTVLIDTEGSRVGQINGLTVIDDGILSFGKPTRITANVSAGNSGILNIEREVELSGSIHSKGVLILTGIIRDRFAQKKPLNLTATLTFEQSYSEVDGDSATAAEIYAIFSALSDIPIRQNFAITGSVNQKGDIQPIGGVNEKIRGFYEICKKRGLNGSHGVVIPIQNVRDLMLPYELISDVMNGKFHIYAISKLEEGIEIMMNYTPGKLETNGEYTEGSLFSIVNKRLDELRESTKESETEKKEKKPHKKKIVKEEVE